MTQIYKKNLKCEKICDLLMEFFLELTPEEVNSRIKQKLVTALQN